MAGFFESGKEITITRLGENHRQKIVDLLCMPGNQPRRPQRPPRESREALVGKGFVK